MVECGLASDEAGSNVRASSIIRASVDRARSAISKYNEETGEINRKKKLIAGCIPPLTECYFANKVPSSVNNLMPEYTVILSTLLDCNVDILLAETLSTAREAIAILRSLSGINEKLGRGKSSHTIPPLWMSFTIHDNSPTKLRSDELLETACKSIIQEADYLNIPLEAVGINCSAPSAISKAVPILTRILEGTSIKVCAYGNCFKTTTSEWISSLDNNDDSGGGTSITTEKTACGKVSICAGDYDEEGYLVPDAYAKYTSEWAKSGAQIIGGCCGSRPKHMAKVNNNAMCCR